MMTEAPVRRWAPSARLRILGWYVTLLAVALTAALLIQRSFLLGQVVVDADHALDQEIGELRQLAGGIDPETGNPFAGDLRSIFDTFLDRNVPLADEAIVTIVGGVPYKSDVSGSFFEGTDLMAHWSSVEESERDQMDTDLGPVRYLAVPLVSGDSTGGVFVVSVLLENQLRQVEGVVRVGALVLGSIFVIASALAWVAAGDVLRPLRLLSETARSITETDLSQRIPVDGKDEIAALARTFNEMLDRLEDAFATQQRFVDDAGHELRTPITVIRGQLEVLGDDPVERQETIRVVTGELDRMSRIVDDLLVLARAEQPDFIETHPIDLAELIDDLATKAAALAGRPVARLPVDPAVVLGDSQRLTQAVMNLVSNAVEHNQPGVDVVLGAAANGEWAQIWVTDNGQGIPHHEQQGLFERFARGGSGRRTRGAGLGLSIVKAIAEGHGGAVKVHSGGGGTTFTIEIPADSSDPGGAA
jgi:signal transduction histidine kinase